MQTELDALRLILAKEHSFSPKMRYLTPSHESMVPLLIWFSAFFRQREVPVIQQEQREYRLRMVNFICESSAGTFYDLTSWQISSITNFLNTLEEEEHGKANRFLNFVEANC